MDSSELILPPVYPFNYHYSAHFRRAPERISTSLPFDESMVSIVSQTPILHSRLLADFDRITIDRAGVMAGEYVALNDGLFLIDRKGNCISVNFPYDSALMARRTFDTANTPQFWELRQWIVENWSRFPLVEHGALWSHIYHQNYYHFTFELLQKARVTDSFDVRNILLPAMLLDRPFQKELLSRIIGDRQLVLFADTPVRMNDPVVADAWQSYEALGWLRRKMAFQIQPGRKRYYIRRTPTVKRGGNNISEDEAFTSFLERHGFQTIDFGNGEIPVRSQVEMLSDASVVIAPHGAGLTNIAYLSPPLTVIEYFGRRVLSASFMRIAIDLGFRYFGIISELEDNEQCIVADVSKLDQIMDEF